MLVDERVVRAVAQSDVAALAGERLVAAVAQRRHHRDSPAGAAPGPARNRRRVRAGLLPNLVRRVT